MTYKYLSRPETTGPNGRGKEAEQAWPTPPDPGDLSKRVALRRAELRLSQAQVAVRAGMSLRYLEYLERYPARPSATTLRQLAPRCRPPRPRCWARGGGAPGAWLHGRETGI